MKRYKMNQWRTRDLKTIPNKDDLDIDMANTMMDISEHLKIMRKCMVFWVSFVLFHYIIVGGVVLYLILKMMLK